MAQPQAPRFAQLLRRAFDVKEGVSPSLLEDYFPVVDVNTPLAEWTHLRGDKRFSAGRFADSGVGLNAVLWLRQPEPGMVTVLEEIWLATLSGAAQFVFFAVTNIGFPAAPSKVAALDVRDMSVALATFPLSTETNISTTGAPVNTHARFLVPATTSVIVKFPLVLSGKIFGGVAPMALSITGQNAGAGNGLVATFIGYERNIEPSEGF